MKPSPTFLTALREREQNRRQALHGADGSLHHRVTVPVADPYFDTCQKTTH